MMMAHSSRTRIFREGCGHFLHACWWLERLILDVHTLLLFGQTKVWDEDDRDAARSPLWLHASLPQTYNWLSSPMSSSCLGLRPPAAMSYG